MTAAQHVIVASWVVLFLFWVGQWRRARRGRSESGRVVNPAYRTGALLEAAAFGILAVSPAAAPPDWMQWTGAAVALGSVVLGVAAGQHLGTQLRVQAVVTDTHRLITSGPYSVVRHPMYATLLGLLITAALGTGRLLGLLLALPVFFAGTEIRVRAEDKILRERFGREFDEYRSRVVAYLPGVR